MRVRRRVRILPEEALERMPPRGYNPPMMGSRKPSEARQAVDDSEHRLAEIMLEKVSGVVGREEAGKLVSLICDAAPSMPQLTPLDLALIAAHDRP